jgi:hypothetical protein
LNVKTSAHYQREYRRRLRVQGLIKKEVWIRPAHATRLAECEKRFRQVVIDQGMDQAIVRNLNHYEAGAQDASAQGTVMSGEYSFWPAVSLYQALNISPLVNQGCATIKLIDGVEPVLHLTMTDYGDLPLFLTVTGEQILVDCPLWPASQVTDTNAFTCIPPIFYRC